MAQNKDKRKRRGRDEERPAAAPSATKREGGEGYRFPVHRIPLIILFFVIAFGGSSVVLLLGQMPQITQYDYEVVAEYPHDSTAFTQGFYYENGRIYESTGNQTRSDGTKGFSTVRISELESGETIHKRELPKKYFGEGLTRLEDRLYQLTWKSHVGFIYDMSLNPQGEFDIDGEGWGLTTDGRSLIVSDGTARLRFLDPESFELQRELVVRTGKRRLYEINELEYIDGKIFANVWHDDSIYIIDPQSGLVEAAVDLRKLYPVGRRGNREAALNGIAFMPETGHLLVTGKLWPKIYQIRLMER